MPTACMVYNPVAGRYPSGMLAERAAHLLSSNGWQIEIIPTHSGEHLTELAYQAAADGLDAFLVVGGDGSLNRALPGLLDSRTALGVLPAGTANVWAQELGLPGLTWTRQTALEESARRLLDAQVHCVDVGLCNGHPFLLWAGIGLDGFVIHRMEPRPRWVKYFAVAHYVTSAALSATAWQGVDLQVEVDGQCIEGHFLMALVSNVHLYAGGYARLEPWARLDDGRMGLWLFQGESIFDTVQMTWSLAMGEHLNSHQAQQFNCCTLRLKSETPLYVQLDGEPLDIRDGLFIEVRPRALHVLAPEQTPYPLFESPNAEPLDCDSSINPPIIP